MLTLQNVKFEMSDYSNTTNYKTNVISHLGKWNCKQVTEYMKVVKNE